MQHVLAEAIRIGQFRSGIIDAFIDGAPQMLEKRAEEIAIERRDGAPVIDKNADGLICSRRRLR